MIALLNQLISGIFDLLMHPFRFQSPWPGLIVSSLCVSIVLIAIFRATSDAAAIRRTRNRLVARTLELILFQHDMRFSLAGCGRILMANAAYLTQFLRPMMFGLIPLFVLFVQLESWFARRPLIAGEQTVLTIVVDPAEKVLKQSASLRVPDSLHIDSLPVRIPASNELAWRLKADGDGEHWVDVTLESEQSALVTERKSLTVGHGLHRLSWTRESSGSLRQLMSPSETPLAISSPIRQMRVSYPARELMIGQTEISWWMAAFLLMMFFSLCLGRLFGVRLA